MSKQYRFFATASKGIVGLLLAELTALGMRELKERTAGVEFSGTLVDAYRACLWSRTANRVLLPLAQFHAADADELYEKARALPWGDFLDVQQTFAVDVVMHSAAITHSQYAMLRVKDAIVDYFRDQSGLRPSVDTDNPQIAINVYLNQDNATLNLDLSGGSLHQRGYRQRGVAAPLKENLAAALLLRAGWPAIAEKGGTLVDPMCGSGTLPIEAALIAGDIAPGLRRKHYGFLHWHEHDKSAWSTLLDEAKERAAASRDKIPPIFGYDRDPQAIRAALLNVTQVGLNKVVQFERGELADIKRPECEHGLFIVNPPYGERIGEETELPALYAQVGTVLRERFAGWKAAVFTGNPDLGKRMGLRAEKYYPIFNGPIECRLLCFNVSSAAHVDKAWTPKPEPIKELGPGATMLANRLRKNLKEFGRWAERENIHCYRLYDADMPEYSFAIDLYRGAQTWAHVQEYAPPKTIDPDKAEERRQDALLAIPQVLELPRAQVFFKLRQKQKEGGQYEKMAETGQFFEVTEGGLRFRVNFSDYLDTGLFLDHRLTRGMLAQLAHKKQFLNLFGYTGSATVYAASGGAISTTHVDMSRTYIDWAQRNMALNGFTQAKYRYVQEDCLQWLAGAVTQPSERGRYGLIFVDPPTFSRSKRMTDTFDVQRDHVKLLTDVLQLLAPTGVLIFSCNLRKFQLDESALAEWKLTDISRDTLPKDFLGNPRIHVCWRIERRQT